MKIFEEHLESFIVDVEFFPVFPFYSMTKINFLKP